MTATAHPTLRQATGPAYTRVLAYGAARGEVSVPNEALIGPIDSSDEWIQQRTGIITRMRAEHDTDAIDLATAAGDEAIASAGIDPALIDLVIVATVSNPKQTPSVSAIVADRVGANPAAAYDVNAACAGYAYAVAQADALIRSGAAKYALVIGAEKLSDVVDPTDRSISFLLGDGAGAALIGPIADLSSMRVAYVISVALAVVIVLMAGSLSKRLEQPSTGQADTAQPATAH